MGLNKWTAHSSLQSSRGRAGFGRESHPRALPFSSSSWVALTRPQPPAPDKRPLSKARSTEQGPLAHTGKVHHELLWVLTPLGAVASRRKAAPTRHWRLLPRAAPTAGSVVSSGEGSQPALNLQHLAATSSPRDQLRPLKPPEEVPLGHCERVLVPGYACTVSFYSQNNPNTGVTAPLSG